MTGPAVGDYYLCHISEWDRGAILGVIPQPYRGSVVITMGGRGAVRGVGDRLAAQSLCVV